jgi:membrane-associated HD superfamily phosphohydrolase
MMLNEYEIYIFMFGLIAFNVSNLRQPFFAKSHSVKLRVSNHTIFATIITMITIVISFSMFYTSFAALGLFVMLFVFFSLSIWTWKHTIFIVRNTKMKRWGQRKRR